MRSSEQKEVQEDETQYREYDFDVTVTPEQQGLNVDVIERISIAAVDTIAVIAALAVFVLLVTLTERTAKMLLGALVGQRAVWALEGYVTFPGVVYHELSHALFAIITGAKVTGISFRRRDDGHGNTTLGSVTFIPRGNALTSGIQTVFASVAPSVTGMAGVALVVFVAIPACGAWWQYVLCAYAVLCLILHSDLSPQDFSSCIAGIPVCIAIMFAVFLVFPVTYDNLVEKFEAPVAIESQQNQEDAPDDSVSDLQRKESNDAAPLIDSQGTETEKHSVVPFDKVV